MSPTYLFFLHDANKLQDWKTKTINELSNLYLEHEHENDASHYLSAVICKSWGMMKPYKQRNDFFSDDIYEMCLIDGVLNAFKYRAWATNEKSFVYKNPNGPYRCILTCVDSRMERLYYSENMSKRSVQFHLYSFDPINSDNDNDNFADAMIYNNNKKVESNGFCKEYIQKLFNKNKYVDALIIYAICFLNESNNHFSLLDTKDSLKNINNDILDTIFNSYMVSELSLKNAVVEINGFVDDRKFGRYLKNLLKKVGCSLEVKELLCC